MDRKLLEIALEKFSAKDTSKSPSDPLKVKKVRDRTFSYTHRHRGHWFRPEYDLDEIQIAQDADSYLLRAVKKKVDRFFLAGYEFVGENETTLEYIKTRVCEMEMATNKPFALLMKESGRDLIRFSNCMWIKTRDDKRSSGRIRKDIRKVELQPVAAYHIIPFETLHFKTRSNGEIKKVMQRLPSGETKEFFPSDVVHFYTNRNPGFSVGTPELLPALDDIALLRRIEENVEELIETNLFPVFHYKIGNDEYPERYGPDGRKESEIVRDKIEYMPSGGVYVSDHRHEVQAIGSESKALRIDFYLTYFKQRVFAAIGVSGVDMGEGGTANRSTASTMSKAAMMDVESLQQLMKTFIEFYVINELLLEGGYNPLDENDKVYVKFGIVDKEERIALENNQIQMFSNKMVTQTEARKNLGLPPLKPEQREDMYYQLYEEPLAMVKGMSAGSAAGETLAGTESSNVTPQAIKKEQTFAKQMEKQKKAGQPQGRPATKSGPGNASASKSRPSNQSGTRSAPKLNKDISLTAGDSSIIISISDNVSDAAIDSWKALVVNRYDELARHGVSFDTVVDNLLPRLYRLNEGSK